jgi:hypothetical protein
MDLKKTKVEGMDWIHLPEDRDWWYTLMNMVLNLQVSKKAGNFSTSWANYQVLKDSAPWNSLFWKYMKEGNVTKYSQWAVKANPYFWCIIPVDLIS